MAGALPRRDVRFGVPPPGRRGAASSRRIPPAMAATLVQLVASAFDVPVGAMLAPSRGPAEVARARQAAMYLAHVGLGMSYARAGRLFGRDRTTAAHACRLIEQLRDAPAFDAAMDHLERALRARHEGLAARGR